MGGGGIFDFWDWVNVALGWGPRAPLRKLHSRRLTRASVREEDCWVYVLWCKVDGTVCVGQTGGRDNYRSVSHKGREHIRLGCAFVRVRGGGICRPRNVYR